MMNCKPLFRPALNRADKRKAAREQRRIAIECKPYAEMTPKERKDTEVYQNALKSIERNGITQADLAREYERGVSEGIKFQQKLMDRKVYSAAAKSLKDVFGFGKTRIVRFMQAFDQNLLELVPDEELTEQWLSECGIELDTGEAFTEDRVKEAASNV